MGLKDILNAGKIKQENDSLKNLMTPEMQDAAKLQEYTGKLKAEISILENTIQNNNANIAWQNNELNRLKSMILSFSDQILVEEFGLYKPRYTFANTDGYKEALSSVRDKQKACIKSGSATTGNMNWTVNGKISAGNKMVRDVQKLLLRAFNSECDELISHVKYNNFDLSLKRITSAAESVSKLGTIMGISITNAYYNLKTEELRLALEYQLKKEEEKEALKQARAEMREAAKLQKELEEQRKKIEKEQNHYLNAFMQLQKQLDDCPEDQKEALILKKEEIEAQLADIEVTLTQLDYREANQKAGYVYVISNLGAFGENIFKIGMTRRLDPQERVDELGDASVPFNFDVHAMIFSDDAPKLENALHKAFEKRKLNMVNQRREFFNVKLDEIKNVVRENFDKTVDFIDVPDAEQYRVSQKIKQINL